MNVGAGLELDLAVGELADADLRTLQVGHDRDFAAELARNLAHELGALHVILRCAVREIQAHDVDAGGEHPASISGLLRRGPERGDDLGGAGHVGRMASARFGDRYATPIARC